jgi:hypothetical protein
MLLDFGQEYGPLVWAGNSVGAKKTFFGAGHLRSSRVMHIYAASLAEARETGAIVAVDPENVSARRDNDFMERWLHIRRIAQFQ